MKSAPRRLARIARTGHVPGPARRVWEARLVRFHIEDLNGLYDRLLIATGDGLDQQGKARIAASQQAACWAPALFEQEAIAFLEAPLERPEDSFGAALLLMATGWNLDQVCSVAPVIRQAILPTLQTMECCGFPQRR